MAGTCTEEIAIRGINDKVAALEKSNDQIHSLMRELTHSLDRVYTSNNKMAEEVKELAAAIIINNRFNDKFDLRLTHLEKSEDVLFSRVRRLEDHEFPPIKDRILGMEHLAEYMKNIPDDVENLKKWQYTMKGSLLVFPGIFSAIAALSAIISTYYVIQGG